MQILRTKLNGMQALLLATLLMLTLLNNFKLNIQTIGFLSIFTLLSSALFFPVAQMSFGKNLPKDLLPVLLSGVCFLGIYIISLLISGYNQRALIVVSELVMVLSFAISVSMLVWSPKAIRIFCIIAIVFTVFILFIYKGFIMVGRGYIANKNTIGGFLAFLNYWPIAYYLLSNKRQSRMILFLFILTSLSGVFIIGARSTWLALTAAATTFVLWPIISKNKFRFYAWFFLALGMLILFINIYLMISSLPIFDQMQRLVRELSGGNLYSGRQIIWPLLIEAIKAQPLLGYGAAASPGLFLSTGLSSHNLYLQIALQVGLIGILFFMILIFSIWKCFWKGRNNQLVRLSAAFMIAILVHQLFEVSLTQNNLAIGLLQWMIIGQGISFSIGSRTTINREAYYTCARRKRRK